MNRRVQHDHVLRYEIVFIGNLYQNLGQPATSFFTVLVLELP